MKRKAPWYGILLFAALLLFCPAGAKAADQKAGWQTVPKYYYYQKDGTLLKKRGLVVIGGKTYYLDKDYSRYSGFKKVKGLIYYFRANGVRYEKAGWKTIGKNTYYFKKNFSLAVGVQKIGKKTYYFGTDGALQKNSKPFQYKKKYYRTNEKGICYSVSALQAQASTATWKFINAHSSAKTSNAARFEKCFRWLVAYMHYRPGYIQIKELSQKEWQYRCVLKVLNNNVTGNCYGFACTVAAVAKELGYEPYVVAMTCDHAVVQIDGKYYDNMGGGKFGASSPYIKDFKIYKKVKY